MDKYLWLAALAMGTLAGCGDDMGLTSVSGTVTLDSQPVPGATVTFVPQGADSVGVSPSSGKTDAEGHYTLMFSRDREGVLPGTHDVTVTTEKIAPADREAMKEAGQFVPDFVPVPQKYSEPGALQQTVEPGSGTIDLELSSE